jgi:hypothetical protein
MASDHAKGAPRRRPDPSSQSYEQRASERIEILGDLHGEVMIFQPIIIRQIGRGGAQIETNFPLQLDSLHEFRLTLGNLSIVAKGRVVHSRISDVDQEIVRYRTGIEFIEMPERVVGAISAFIDALKIERGTE